MDEMPDTPEPATPEPAEPAPPPEPAEPDTPEPDEGEQAETHWWEKWQRKADADDDEAESTPPAAAPPPAGKGKGTQAAPLSQDDVPEQWVRVRVDGQDTVLSLRDCVQRGIAAATLQRRFQELAAERKTMTAAQQKADQDREALRGWLQQVSTSPEALRGWFRRHAPDVFRQAAEAEIYDLVSTKPEEREARQLAEERARLEADRAAWQRAQDEAQQARAVEQAQATLRPMLERAASAAGIEMGQEFISLMRLRLDPIFAAGRMPTQQEMIAAAQALKKRLSGIAVLQAPAPVPPKQPTPPRTPQREGRSAPAKPPARKPKSFDHYWRDLDGRFTPKRPRA